MSHNGFHDPALAIAYQSGYGHTGVLAEAVARGVRDGGASVNLVAVDAMTDSDWDLLDAADGIVFPSTHGGPRGDYSGFISCSSVGTNSLTVGWMCMVRANVS
jgi:NAD(P)H dehydrogenase (quinone)